MDAEKWKDTILAKSREYVEMGVSVASDLTEKGKTQAKILSNQAKIGRAQRQLGALVYSLAKGNEENQPLVDRYIDMIDSIEQENRQLKAKLTPAEASEVEHASADVEADMADVMADPVQEEAAPAEEAAGTPGEADARKYCPQCGAEVAADALFCTKCGAQLCQDCWMHRRSRAGGAFFRSGAREMKNSGNRRKRLKIDTI